MEVAIAGGAFLSLAVLGRWLSWDYLRLILALSRGASGLCGYHLSMSTTGDHGIRLGAGDPSGGTDVVWGMETAMVLFLELATFIALAAGVMRAQLRQNGGATLVRFAVGIAGVAAFHTLQFAGQIVAISAADVPPSGVRAAYRMLQFLGPFVPFALWFGLFGEALRGRSGSARTRAR